MNCERCGRALPESGVCLACNAPPGLGDMLAAALSAVGITPERVSSALGVDDCGCEARRQWLNEAGRAIGIGKEPKNTD